MVLTSPLAAAGALVRRCPGCWSASPAWVPAARGYPTHERIPGAPGGRAHHTQRDVRARPHRGRRLRLADRRIAAPGQARLSPGCRAASTGPFRAVAGLPGRPELGAACWPIAAICCSGGGAVPARARRHRGCPPEVAPTQGALSDPLNRGAWRGLDEAACRGNARSCAPGASRSSGRPDTGSVDELPSGAGPLAASARPCGSATGPGPGRACTPST